MSAGPETGEFSAVLAIAALDDAGERGDLMVPRYSGPRTGELEVAGQGLEERMICARCGTVFCVDLESDAFWLSSGSVLYCSKMCKKRAQPGDRKHRRELNQNPRKVRRQVAFMRRRDGDDCYLCGFPIDFGIGDINDPMHYSRDHVIPRALGGERGEANMRLVHRRCNAEKGQALPAADPRDAPTMPFPVVTVAAGDRG